MDERKALMRNKFVMEIADEITVAYILEGGVLRQILEGEIFHRECQFWCYGRGQLEF